MGGYCRFCGRRCFLLRILRDGSTFLLATCAAGMDWDRKHTGTGEDHTTALNPTTGRRDSYLTPCPSGEHGGGELPCIHSYAAGDGPPHVVPLVVFFHDGIPYDLHDEAADYGYAGHLFGVYRGAVQVADFLGAAPWPQSAEDGSPVTDPLIVAAYAAIPRTSRIATTPEETPTA